MEPNDSNFSEAEIVQDSTQAELNHSDKIVGLFTEPAKTFESMSKYPVRTIDWLLPVFLMLLAVSLSTILISSNKQLGEEAKRKQMAKIEKGLQEQVNKGTLSQEQANEQLAKIEERFDPRNPLMMVITFFSIVVFGLVFFFLITGIYYLFSKFALGGVGTYKSSLAANGLVGYIGILQVLLTTILAFTMGRIFADTSVASFMNIDKTTFTGMLLSKVDVVSIWIYIVLSIALAKMFKSTSTVKYYVMVFGLWIFWSLFIHFGSKAFPVLENFIR